MSALSNPLISFVILTWNSEHYLRRCFDSIIFKCNEEKVSCEVLVIDNGSSDGSCDVVTSYQNTYPETFHLIALDANHGTTYTRNLGLKQACGEYICVLDSDTELGAGSLEAVIKRLGSDEQIGLMVPQLVLPDGSIQNSVKRFPTMLNKLMKIPRIVFGIKTKNNDFYENFPFAGEQLVDTAISACWFFKKALLQKIGYLDEKIFYSPEDIDFSLRVWQAGLHILYYPALSVFHHTQQITHRKPLSKTSISHFFGLIYYYRKHGGWLSRQEFRKP